MSFEIHRPPRASRMEPWWREVAGMRAANWPCRRIAAWLAERGVVISAEGVRQFCKVRGIGKAAAPVSEPPEAKVTTVSRPVPVKPTTPRSKKFRYDGDGPIETTRS